MASKIIRLFGWSLLTALAGAGLLTWVQNFDSRAWSITGEVVRNTNALAVIAASIAAYIAWGTNRERVKESVRSDFKDRINWAAQNYTGDTTLTSIAAGRFIDTFAESETLHPEDLATARALSTQKQQIAQEREAKMIATLEKTKEALGKLIALKRDKSNQRNSTDPTLACLNQDLELVSFEYEVEAIMRIPDNLEHAVHRYSLTNKYLNSMMAVANYLETLEDKDMERRVTDDTGNSELT